MGLDNAWDEAGNFIGDSTVSDVADAAGGGIPWQTIMKYLLPSVGGATNALQTQKALDQQKALVQTGQALDQSKLDPFRGINAQTSALGKLERAATPPPAYGPAKGSRYASAVPTRAPISLSPTYSTALRNAQSSIAQGKGTMPNMLDSANWGNPGTMDLTTAPPANGGLSLTSLLARYKPKTDDADVDPMRQVA